MKEIQYTDFEKVGKTTRKGFFKSILVVGLSCLTIPFIKSLVPKGYSVKFHLNKNFLMPVIYEGALSQMTNTYGEYVQIIGAVYKGSLFLFNVSSNAILDKDLCKDDYKKVEELAMKQIKLMPKGRVELSQFVIPHRPTQSFSKTSSESLTMFDKI
jgi:hypothetical protein